MTDWKFRAEYFEDRARYYDARAEEMKAEATQYRKCAADAGGSGMSNVDLLRRLIEQAEHYSDGHGPLHAAAANAIAHLETQLAAAPSLPEREEIAGLADYLAHTLKMNESLAHIPEMAAHRANIARWELAVRRLGDREQEVKGSDK